MTYQELTDRLTKCENTLEKFKSGNYTSIPSSKKEDLVNKLTILKESLEAQILEANKKTYLVTPKSGETSALSLDDKEVDALEDADDIEGIKGADGSEVKEMSDDEFAAANQATRLDNHPESEMIKKIQALINNEKKNKLSEAPDSAHYIKVESTELMEALGILEKAFADTPQIKFELNDPDTIYVHNADKGDVHDAVEELQQNGIIIDQTSIDSEIEEDAEEDAKNDADYAQGWHDDPRQDEDTDVGHQDDEPSMLKASAFETAEYAAKLVKKLAKYDQQDGEVDFPNWWQKKLILARDYMSAAYHYLDSEEKQPAIDQLALEGTLKEGRGDMERIVDLITDRAAESGFSVEEEAQEVVEAIQDYYKLNGVEENVDKVAGGIPYKVTGSRAIITEPLDDATKERIIKRAKESGYHAAPNMAGGITIILKKGMNEDRFITAAFEDLEQVIRNLAHTAEISEDEALEMAIRKLEAMLDGRDDLDEGVAKTKKAHDLVVNKMKQLAKQYKSGDTSVISQLKDLTAKKKSLEAMLDRDVAGTGRDQELDEEKGGKYVVRPCSAKDQPWAVWKTSEGGEDDKRIKGFKTKPEAKAFADKKNGVDEAGPGFKHDCAAKVVHETYGEGNCIPEKHTLVKEGTKYVVTHYDVLFENGKTVEDIPVNELDIKTTNEHWHKGYKKKKK